MDRSMGCAKAPPAIPSSIGHLLLQQVSRNGVETIIVAIEVGEDGQHHPGDAGFALAPPSAVDAALVLKPIVEQERARLSRLPVASRQAEVAQLQHCIGGRDPLWRVEPSV